MELTQQYSDFYFSAPCAILVVLHVDPFYLKQLEGTFTREQNEAYIGPNNDCLANDLFLTIQSH
jgi:hypothetical protein